MRKTCKGYKRCGVADPGLIRGGRGVNSLHLWHPAGKYIPAPVEPQPQSGVEAGKSKSRRMGWGNTD